MKTSAIFFFACYILLLSSVKISANLWSVPDIPENLTESEVFEKWIKLDKNLKGAMHSVIKSLMPKLLESSEQMKISPQCVKESLHLISGLRSLKKWAFGFIDSSAKIPDGLLAGSLSFLGMYEECLNISVPDPKNKKPELYRGKYCTIEGAVPLPPKKRRYRLHDQVEAIANFSESEVLKFLSVNGHLNYFFRYHLGVCIPSGCSEEDLNQLLQLGTEYLQFNFEVTHCEVAKGKVQLSGIQIFTIVLYIFLGIIVLVATWFDIRIQEKDKFYDRICCRILLCFSLKSNFKRLASTHTSSDSLKCIHGMRFLSITWVILAHTYLYPGWFVRSYSSMALTERILTTPIAQMFMNGSECVDSFFFIAGMLVCYVTLKLVKTQNKKFNIKVFIIHRLWRIIPVYYVILLFATIAPLLGSGPLFHETMTESFESCSKYWWRNALFINNFFHFKDICMMHTWFVSCELQLYVLSLIVLLPMFKSEKIGVAITIVLIALSIIYNGIIIYAKDVAPTLIMKYPDPMDRNIGFLYLYANTISRFGPYFIGVLVGYLTFKFPDIKIPKKYLIFGWFLAIVSSGTTIFITGYWFRVREPTKLEELMYGTFYKVSYTAGIAWMIFCCVTGHGGFINDLLSWKAWVPLGKLAFLIYLIAPIYQTLFIANFTILQEVSHLILVTEFFGFLCISSLLAMIVNLLVESPLLQVEKIFFEKAVIKMEQQETENGMKKDIPIIITNCKNNSTTEKDVENMSFDTKI